MQIKPSNQNINLINIVWLRRDLRLLDHAALYHALKSNKPVLMLFIFDSDILNPLEKDDARVNFIYSNLLSLKASLQMLGSDLLIEHGQVTEIWKKLISQYPINTVYINEDYEPSAIRRDSLVKDLLNTNNINLLSFKDQVIFEKKEICKADNQPYTVFTPYYKQWRNKVSDFYIKSYPTANYFNNFKKIKGLTAPTLESLGFKTSTLKIRELAFETQLFNYENLRDVPAADAGTYIGIHLRFGTVSIRQVVQEAIAQKAEKWLSELAWREFYMMILYHFPKTINQSFKPAYDFIAWRNNEKEFEAWCTGNTGYPLVDAGMHQLNQTGYMHNRVRMVVASFLCKHLLIDWRWGEAYFAQKLLDYEQASNVGGWQWACGCGNDAAPYFRVFNPTLQQQKFDPTMKYVLEWAPEYKLAIVPIPIVDHAFARDRALRTYKLALQKS